MHRDLKPANLLLNKRGILKIIDFGWARLPDISYMRAEKRHITPNSVTPLYRAPEIFFEQTIYNEKVDMWSAGCIFYEILTSQVLFCQEQGAIGIVRSMIRMLGFPNETSWPGCTQLRQYQPINKAMAETVKEVL